MDNINNTPLNFYSPNKIDSASTKIDITEKEFNDRFNQLISDGNRLRYDVDGIADEALKLVKQYPDYAANAKLPTTFLELRGKIVIPSRFKATNIRQQTDPAKNFEITVTDSGTRDGKAFDGKMTITKGTGESLTVKASTWPDPDIKSKKGIVIDRNNPGIIEGKFPAVYSTQGHKNGPGIRVNNNQRIQTIGANPNQNEEYFADYIHIHCGYPDNDQSKRGSDGCITIQKDECQQVWNFLEDGSTGLVNVKRTSDKIQK